MKSINFNGNFKNIRILPSNITNNKPQQHFINKISEDNVSIDFLPKVVYFPLYDKNKIPNGKVIVCKYNGLIHNRIKNLISTEIISK